MIDRLIQTAALLCPTGKVIPLSCHNTDTTVRVLKQLQLKLDRALKQQYGAPRSATLLTAVSAVGKRPTQPISYPALGRLQ